MTELEHAWSPYVIELPPCTCAAHEARNQSKHHDAHCYRWGVLRMREKPSERYVYHDYYGWMTPQNRENVYP